MEFITASVPMGIPAAEPSHQVNVDIEKGSLEAPVESTISTHKTQIEQLLALRPQLSDEETQARDAQIIRQVEFYFSDENLPTDKFLLERVGHTENRPISLRTIHAFKKMQEYQPYKAVVAALRKSQVLDIDGDIGKETVKRKVGLVVEKKKKTKKSKTAKYGTGFEEFYAEPPITPGDYAEEQEDYHWSRPFNERIETCIQRYRAKRTMSELRVSAFDKYLSCGGVQTGAKAFGHTDQAGLEELNAQEIRGVMARDNITSATAGRNDKYYSPEKAEYWSVDFTAVAKAFLSHRAPLSLGANDQIAIRTYCNLVENFLNYVLTHSVCPEYTDDILTARKLCGFAEKELWAIYQVGMLLPGPFNTAAAFCYSNSDAFQNIHIDAAWDQDDDQYTKPLDLESAETIVLVGLGACGTKAQISAMEECECQPSLLASEHRSFEIVTIRFAKQALVDELMTKQHPSIQKNVTPEAIGTIELKSWSNPAAEEEDLTEEEEEDVKTKSHDLVDTEITSLFFENSILEKMFIGMKFTCTLHTTSAGFSYIDNLGGVYPSFYTYLPNEMMSSWKTPAENTRAPPQVGDQNIGMDDEVESAQALGNADGGVKVSGLD